MLSNIPIDIFEPAIPCAWQIYRQAFGLPLSPVPWSGWNRPCFEKDHNRNFFSRDLFPSASILFVSSGSTCLKIFSTWIHGSFQKRTLPVNLWNSLAVFFHWHWHDGVHVEHPLDVEDLQWQNHSRESMQRNILGIMKSLNLDLLSSKKISV